MKTIEGLNNLQLAKNKKIKYIAPIRFVGKTTISCDIEIGGYTYIRSGIIKSCNNIGNYCSIGPNIRIGENNHPLDWLSTSGITYGKSRFMFYEPFKKNHQVHEDCKVNRKSMTSTKGPVLIEHDVWIGSDCKIMRGVTIGTGAVIAAGAVVTKNVEPYAIVAGIPAKVIKYRFEKDIIDELIELKWWNYDITSTGINFSDIRNSINQIKKLKKENKLKKLDSFISITKN